MVGSKCRAVYVHWDGYLDGVGAALQDYTTQAEVEELISHGDRSSLEDGYYKERGETGVDPTEYTTFEEFLDAANGCGAEYYYVFKDGVWYCGDCYGRWGSDSKISGKLVAYNEARELERLQREAEEEME
jgi:hypothetical protein